MSYWKRIILSIVLLFGLLFVGGCEFFEDENNYTDDEWTVTFQNYDGSFLAYAKVKDGQDAKYTGYFDPIKPSDETHVYVFDGWDKPLTKIREDCVRTAKYKAEDRYYTVTFKNGYTEIDKQKCLYGGSVTFHGVEPTKAADSSGSYEFSGWSIKLDNITKDCVAEAMFTLIKNVYEWTFYDSDGRTVLAKVSVAHGETPKYPTDKALPTKQGNAQYTYTFSGWDNIYTWTQAKSNGSSKAVYSASVNSYTATFNNYDGSTLYRVSVKYGSSAVYTGATPKKPSTADTDYTFSGWDKNLTITGNTIFTAIFTSSVRKYEVSFIGGNGNTLYTESVPYGKGATYQGTTPTKNSDGQFNYEFSKWDKEYDSITSDTVVTALFNSSINIDNNRTLKIFFIFVPQNLFYRISFYDIVVLS